MSIFGNWQAITAFAAGEEMPDGLADTIRLSLTEDTYAVTVAGQPDKGSVSYDHAANPPRITILGTDGPNAGGTLKAIYKFEGGVLTIAYDRSGAAFPEDFNSQPGRNDFVATYKRIE